MSRHGSSRGSGGRYGMEHAMGSLIGLMIFLLIIYIIVLTKMLNMVCRVMKQHPDNKALWIQAGLSGICLLLALVTAMEQMVASVFLSIGGISFLTLAATARFIEVYHNKSFIEEKVSLRDRLLDRPWWKEQEQLEEA